MEGRLLSIFLFLWIPSTLWGVDSFYDPHFDYSRFPGRLTDKKDDNTVLKISGENPNIRFFKRGDRVMFQFDRPSISHLTCRGLVRGVEKHYFILYVRNIQKCLGRSSSRLRRGAHMNFHSPTLAQRVLEASRFRQILIEKKADFLRQLNQLNNELWSFHQRRLKIIANYEEEILKLEKERERELRVFNRERKDKADLKRDLIARLDQLKFDLEFYRVVKPEILKDRWGQDHDLALPVGRRPQPLKTKEAVPEKIGRRDRL